MLLEGKSLCVSVRFLQTPPRHTALERNLHVGEKPSFKSTAHAQPPSLSCYPPGCRLPQLFVSPQNPRAPKHRPAMWINAQFRSGDICRAPPSAKRRKYMYPRLVVHLPRIPCSTGSRGVRPLCCFLPLRPGCLGPLSPLPHAPRPLEFVSPLSPRTELRSPPQPSVVRSKTSPRPVLRTQPVKTKG